MIAMAARGWQHHSMRYEPSQRLLRLARHLAASRAGLTLDEMAAELEVGRRTAERLRDSLAAMFPQMECWDDDERVRRWRLPGSALVGVVEPRPEAVAAIEISARECTMRGEADRAALLREAATTLRAVMRPDALRRAEPDIAALMEAEGIAMRPGPRPIIAVGVLPALRRAILGMQLVVVRYAGSDAEKPAARILCPYGILYGGGWIGSSPSICLIAGSRAARTSISQPMRRSLSGYSRRNRSTWCCGSNLRRRMMPPVGCFIRRRVSSASPAVR
jgi:predicted DNA-binding transcriptional regulator YafY